MDTQLPHTVRLDVKESGEALPDHGLPGSCLRSIRGGLYLKSRRAVLGGSLTAVDKQAWMCGVGDVAIALPVAFPCGSPCPSVQVLEKVDTFQVVSLT